MTRFYDSEKTFIQGEYREWFRESTGEWVCEMDVTVGDAHVIYRVPHKTLVAARALFNQAIGGQMAEHFIPAKPVPEDFNGQTWEEYRDSCIFHREEKGHHLCCSEAIELYCKESKCNAGGNPG